MGVGLGRQHSELLEGSCGQYVCLEGLELLDADGFLVIRSRTTSFRPNGHLKLTKIMKETTAKYCAEEP